MAWSYNLIFFETLQLCCFTIDMRSYKLCLIFKLLSVTVAILPEILKSCHKGDCSREKMPQHGDPYAYFISGSFPYLWKPISSISKKGRCFEIRIYKFHILQIPYLCFFYFYKLLFEPLTANLHSVSHAKHCRSYVFLSLFWS